MNLTELAQRLKRVRLQRGLTLEQVATQAGLSRGWLSKVENFRLTPSLPALSEIASVLDVSLSELFEGLEAEPGLVVVRSDQRVEYRRDEPVSKIRYASLAHARPKRSMDPFLLKVPVEDDREKLPHKGEEFLYVLSGQARLDYGDDSHELNPGDSVYFDGEVPHRVVCRDGEECEVLVVFHDVGGEASDHIVADEEAEEA
ncbi:helix-turn-helix domain-containing protein [Crateriforma conspicua]|uniref:helix-turn-helix domain-containing protein n=1 Tax=Crateriforma conspicua TaxID=2527996 RepID=UPI00118C29FC|nr:cupin domain-containing protein [Crateriforma conspicua]QDV64412.1 HTH-type transcriptional regulator PuuR [Crateriforma conspicua]